MSPPVSERRAAQLADTVEVTPGEPLPPMPRGKRPKVATSKGRERTTNRGLILAVSALGGGMAVAIVGGILLFVAYALFSKGERAGSSPPQKSVLSELTAAEVALLKSAEAGRSWLDVHTVQPGEAGFIREPITILQVAADDAFLTNVNGVTVLIVGVDTSRLADGRPWHAEYDAAFFCRGPISYTTALNTRKTVMALEPFDASAAIAKFEALSAELRATEANPSSAP